MYESVATLLGEPIATYDTYGNEVIDYTRREVFVTPRSVYSSEFYQAAQLGLHPSIVLTITTRADYHDEKLVEFEGALFDVVRADWTNAGDSVSLTLEKRISNS